MLENIELPILGFDAVTFYVGNARQAAFFYNQCFGFEIAGYRGPETGCPDTASYLLKQNHITFIMTSALTPDHPIAAHVNLHGDGIKDLGMRVSEAKKEGERTIQAYGETTHTFYQAGEAESGFEPYHVPAKSIGLVRVDHAVGNVESGKLETWVDYYQRIFGFYVLRHYSEKDISTDYSALVSKVMANQAGTIKLPLNEPAAGLKKSQIQEFLEYYHGPGIQHLAIATDNIIETVQQLRQNHVGLMSVPQSYYDHVAERVGTIDESIAELAKLGIIVDRDEDGYLLQIFTQPLQDRPTLFFEIIQRHGATGFGKGNFKALFEAIERDQAKRGNL